MTTETAGLLLAQATQPETGPAAWTSPLLMMAVLLGIFYFIVLRPGQQRQKKVAAFQAALKEGDRVITTGGIYGVVTDVKEQWVQLQLSDNPKVRIKVSKAAIGGYQGQEPVAPERPQ